MERTSTGTVLRRCFPTAQLAARRASALAEPPPRRHAELRTRALDVPHARVLACSSRVLYALIVRVSCQVYGSTALMEASANGNEGCVQLLLEAGATVNDTEVSLERAFTQAHATCASKPWASPSSAIASHQVDGWAALHVAAYNGRLAIAKRLLQGGADPSTRNKDGKTALDYARERGNSEVVALLAC